MLQQFYGMTQLEVLNHVTWRTAHHRFRLLEESSTAHTQFLRQHLYLEIRIGDIVFHQFPYLVGKNLILLLGIKLTFILCQLILDIDIVFQAKLILGIAESIISAYTQQDDIDEISPPSSPPRWKNGDGHLAHTVLVGVGGIHHLHNKLIGSRWHIGIGSQTVLACIVPVVVEPLQTIAVADALRIVEIQSRKLQGEHRL